MKTVLLSFDIEEFDMPLEYGRSIAFEKQIAISAAGTEIILDLLAQHKVVATFFSTVVFAVHATPLILRLKNAGHELASHGYYHSSFENEHLISSKEELEKLSNAPVNGFRMARMMPVDDRAIEDAGYLYNSSLNPVYLPGRYNNFFKPRTRFTSGNLIQLPASAVPIIRVPLFWLSFHNLSLDIYKLGCRTTINQDRYLNLYFHPWEFTDLTVAELGMPSYVSRNSGKKMIERFDSLLSWMRDEGYTFSTISEFLARKQ